MGGEDGEETRGHPATRMIPADFAEARPNRYPFFVDYFSCGLYPPLSDFFSDTMHTFGFHLMDFTPNAVACMALFAHLCEGFAGVHPNTALFRITSSLGSKQEVPSRGASPRSQNPRERTRTAP